MDGLTTYLYIAAGLIAIFFVLAFVYLSIAMPFHVYQSKRKIDRVSAQVDKIRRDVEALLERTQGSSPEAAVCAEEKAKKG